MRVVHGDGLGCPACSKADRHGRTLVRNGSITHLSPSVFAPTLERSVTKDSTTVVVAEGHRIGGQSGPEVHPSWSVAVRVDPAVPQRSITIVAPTHQGTVGKDTTRLTVAGGHLVVAVRQRRGVRQGDGKHAAERADAADEALTFHVAVVGEVASHVHVGRPIVRANAIATRRPADDA